MSIDFSVAQIMVTHAKKGFAGVIQNIKERGSGKEVFAFKDSACNGEESKEDFSDLIEHLEKLGKGEILPKRSYRGICSELHEQFDDIRLRGFVRTRSPGWKHYSGEERYPVGGQAECERLRLWEDDEWGDKRRDLCLYLAQSLRDNPVRDW